jgi:2-hydroxychromene-2-carboxylate isomerase
MMPPGASHRDLLKSIAAMAKVVDYYFSPMSPWTYLGHARFSALLARYGAQVKVKPADYGKIFAASGGVPVKQRPVQRQAYRMVELRRFRDHTGLPLNLEPKFFPVPTE